MQTRFLHFADCHLGYRQYNSQERYNDFARAFVAVINRAIAEKVDFVILAGDLFQKRAIDALTLNQAMIGLEKLRNAGIPCLAVEGNHEHAYYGDYIGWMEFLAQRRLLVLLDAEFVDGRPQLLPYNERRRVGSYIDPVPGLRVHGLRYRGASTATAVAAYAEALAELPGDGIDYTIFVTHAGMEGVLADRAGGLSYRQWSVLQPYVDYVALGHIHKPFSREEWLYNPGSTESCSIAEAAWSERGYFLVEVNTERAETDAPKHGATLHANPRRAFHRLSFKVDLHRSPADLYAACGEFVQRKARDLGVARLAPEQRPVVELALSGVLPFDRSALDFEQLEALVHQAFDPLVAHVRNLTQGAEFQIDAQQGLTRGELERQILVDLLQRDARFQADAQAWSRLALALKNLALGGAGPDAILEELSSQIALIEA